MENIIKIKNDIQTKKFYPIYLLMGEEDFFINNITKLLIDNVLTNDEKQFNLNILYAKDTSVNEIVYLCRKYPIMSNYQVVLIAAHL